jgi:quercetin dioxygenase-like cupin family protein
MQFAKYWLVGSLLVFSIWAAAQESDKPNYMAASTSKFTNFPGVPQCMTGAVQQGDPSKGDAVLLLKAKTGCIVPWHWHTATERVMMVSGRAKADMKDGSPATLRAGDFLNLDPKHIHQFTCQMSCTLFDISSSAPFDIHYVDAAGNEIPAEQALKAETKTATTKMQQPKAP